MSIVDELKKLIIARGGSVAGVQTIAEAVRVLVNMESEDNTETEPESEPKVDTGDTEIP